MKYVSTEIISGVAIVSINNPPVNATSQHVRAGLIDAIQQIEMDDVKTAVLICDGWR